MSVEIPRAASSAPNPEVYMCSLVLSRPFHMTMTGAGPRRRERQRNTPARPASNGTSTSRVSDRELEGLRHQVEAPLVHDVATCILCTLHPFGLGDVAGGPQYVWPAVRR